jgi:hypothetical protein
MASYKSEDVYKVYKYIKAYYSVIKPHAWKLVAFTLLYYIMIFNFRGLSANSLPWFILMPIISSTYYWRKVKNLTISQSNTYVKTYYPRLHCLLSYLVIMFFIIPIASILGIAIHLAPYETEILIFFAAGGLAIYFWRKAGKMPPAPNLCPVSMRLAPGTYKVGDNIFAGQYIITVSNGCGQFLVYENEHIVTNALINDGIEHQGISSLRVFLCNENKIQFNGINNTTLIITSIEPQMG